MQATETVAKQLAKAEAKEMEAKVLVDRQVNKPSNFVSQPSFR
ncbi:hypothetical protein ACP4OV_007384 [Aristida adscensionis]